MSIFNVSDIIYTIMEKLHYKTVIILSQVNKCTYHTSNHKSLWEPIISKQIKIKSDDYKYEFKDIVIANRNANHLILFIKTIKTNDYFSLYNNLFISTNGIYKLNLKLLNVDVKKNPKFHFEVLCDSVFSVIMHITGCSD